jgi:hypothetical protein
MKTPDFTPVGIASIVLAFITNLVVLFNLDLSDAQRGAITGLVSAIVLAAFLIHDAVIRHGRAKVAAAAVTAAVASPDTSVTPTRLLNEVKGPPSGVARRG